MAACLVKVLLHLGAAGDTGDGDELVKHLGHVLADDDLELGAGELRAQHALDLLDLLNVCKVVVLEREAQARHAVGRGGYVACTSHQL